MGLKRCVVTALRMWLLMSSITLGTVLSRRSMTFSMRVSNSRTYCCHSSKLQVLSFLTNITEPSVSVFAQDPANGYSTTISLGSQYSFASVGSSNKSQRKLVRLNKSLNKPTNLLPARHAFSTLPVCPEQS